MSNRKPMAAIAQMSHCNRSQTNGAGTAGEEDIGSGQASTLMWGRQDSRQTRRRPGVRPF